MRKNIKENKIGRNNIIREKKNSEETTIEKQLVPFRWSTKQYITTLRVVFMKLLNFGFLLFPTPPPQYLPKYCVRPQIFTPRV